MLAQLADAGGLARAVHARDHHHERLRAAEHQRFFQRLAADRRAARSSGFTCIAVRESSVRSLFTQRRNSSSRNSVASTPASAISSAVSEFLDTDASSTFDADENAGEVSNSSSTSRASSRDSSRFLRARVGAGGGTISARVLHHRLALPLRRSAGLASKASAQGGGRAGAVVCGQRREGFRGHRGRHGARFGATGSTGCAGVTGVVARRSGPAGRATPMRFGRFRRLGLVKRLVPRDGLGGFGRRAGRRIRRFLRIV